MALSCLISTSQGYRLSRTTAIAAAGSNAATVALQWCNVSRLVAFMMEVFRGKDAFQFGLGAATTCCTTVQPLVSAGEVDHFLVSLVHVATAEMAPDDDDNDERPPEATFLAVLAAYLGATVRTLFAGDVGRCSAHLGAAAAEMLSKSTFHDTMRAGGGGGDGGDGGGEDDADPFVAAALSAAAPPLGDALAVYEEHFLEPLLAAALAPAGFQPRWFDTVFRYHGKHGAAAGSCCTCALHITSPDPVGRPDPARTPLLMALVGGRSERDGVAAAVGPPWWAPAAATFASAHSVPPGGRCVGVQIRVGRGRDQSKGGRGAGRVLVISALGFATGDATLVAVGAFSPGTVLQQPAPEAAGEQCAAGWVPLPEAALKPRFWQAWGAAEARLVTAFFGGAAGYAGVDANHYEAALRATMAADAEADAEFGIAEVSTDGDVAEKDEKPPPPAAPAAAVSMPDGGSRPSSASPRPGRTLRPAAVHP